jgi:rhamnose utilization protein RhaD (predicted bifunctional aldolase and dehydrogenase)
MPPSEPPAELIELSHHLGDPVRDYAILGEGNTSCRGDTDTFWIKASGSHLGSLRPRDLVRVRLDRVTGMLDRDLNDQQVLDELRASRADGADGPLPSVETVMHAVCLAVEGVNYVGHTHPTSINMVTCSARWHELFSGRLFPDHVVVCGPASVLVPYVDPGLPLAREIRRRIAEFIQQTGERPRTIYMQNHGFIALGGSARDVMNITAMAVKAARILVGAAQTGGAVFLSPGNVLRIHGRPDEHYRQRVIGGE